MTRLILRALNAPALVLLAALAIAIQTALFQAWPLQYIQPDIVLLLTLWCALRRNFTEGGIIVLLIADIAEIHGAAPQGFFLMTYMLVYLLVRLLARVLVIPNLSSVVTLTLFASIFWKIAGLGILHLLGASGNQWRHTFLYLFPGSLIEGGLGFWIYRWLERFDWITFKSPRQDASLEDELQLEGDGF